jgi:hypothetical protein
MTAYIQYVIERNRFAYAAVVGTGAGVAAVSSSFLAASTSGTAAGGAEKFVSTMSFLISLL